MHKQKGILIVYVLVVYLPLKHGVVSLLFSMVHYLLFQSLTNDTDLKCTMESLGNINSKPTEGLGI